MPTLEELVRKQSEIQQAIVQARAEKREAVLTEVRTIMSAHGLTAADIVVPRKSSSSAGVARKPVAAKFRDNAGNSWSGRGLKPKWLTEALAAGKSMQDFAV